MASAPQLQPPEDQARLIAGLVNAVVQAVDAGSLLSRRWPTDLSRGPCHLFAAGKASASMVLEAVRRRLCEPVDGVAVVPDGAATGLRSALHGLGLTDRFLVLEADHPLPTARNIAAAGALADVARLAAHAAANPAIVLISGGASAHLTLPRPGLTLEDIREATSLLQRAGATIHELNAVRGNCEVLKHGGLAAMLRPIHVTALLLSDVTSNDPAVIGSGPCLSGRVSVKQALDVLRRRLPPSACPRVVAYLEREAANAQLGHTSATPEARHVIVGTNEDAVVAAAEHLKHLGLAAETTIGVSGEARAVAAELVRAATRRMAAQRRDGVAIHGAIVWGGECTVHVTGDGRGGRNQEFALAAAMEIHRAGSESAGLVVASFCTDGIDGSTDAAGAWVNETTVPTGLVRGIDPVEALRRNDSHTFFSQLPALAGGVIHTGPTGTNVNDVMLAMW